MSDACGFECVVTYIGNDDSAMWLPATYDEFEPIRRLCRTILVVYEDDLHNPKFPHEGGYRLNPN
uniref:Mono-/di-acylglycerol lipase N-terminal domain-containing protein n=1 Tax=Solanum lycopersicum TaxID=4081 RepID=A0A3Q7I4W6_SOLLC